MPASSGSVDLSAVRPVNSGTMSFDDVLSKARASAAAKGATSYDRPLVYGSDARGGSGSGGGDRDRDYGNPRSRSPRGDYRDDRRGGRGRDYGRDRSHSPPNRSRNSPRGGGRDRSPLRGSGGGSDDNSETIDVESSLVGLIIGRQGENLRRIESESNCRVQFLPPTDGSSFRQCRITGPRANRADVRAAINRIIEDSGMGPMNRGADKGGNAGGRGGNAEVTPQDGEDFLQIMVPDRTVGLIIGRGGETIRDLQERSGCHINIVGESKSLNGLRPVNLIGTPEAAAKAKDFIMEVVDSDSRGEGPAAKRQQTQQQSGYGGGSGGGGRQDNYGGGSGDRINDSVYVPSDAVGMIIGKGGETIREMQSSTGCKINVAQSSGPGEVQREVSLIGSADAIARAKQAIDEKVEAVVSSSHAQPLCVANQYTQRQKSSGGGYDRRGGGGGRGYHDNNDRGNYSQQGSNSASQQQQQPAASGDGADPYAQCKLPAYL